MYLNGTIEMKEKNTIAAIATAMSSSGIGIIRISGGEAFSVIDQIFCPKKKGKRLSSEKSHTAHFGWIKENDRVIDEVLVLIMKGPGSYTGEDTVEINCHGGVFVMKRILEAVLRHGARAAEPGEFTKRAFLNGRLDLSQAEAVIDVIHAKNDYALRSSLSQLTGFISDKIKNLREEILYQIAFIESALDDPEHISLDGYAAELGVKLDAFIKDVEKMASTFDSGRYLSEGIQTVILGKPNAGKSSLLNILVGEERAIVTEIAGTTRDTLEEQINVGGISLNIIDTAGIRKTDDVVEKIGVTKARERMEKADLILYVVDSSVPLDENDYDIIEWIRDKKALILLNKIDLHQILSEQQLEAETGKKIISISAKSSLGIDRLSDEIKDMFFQGELEFNDQVCLTNIRHKAAVDEALNSLRLCLSSVESGMPEDFYSIDLMNAYEQLGFIIGESVEEDLVNQIFSKFCMGK